MPPRSRLRPCARTRIKTAEIVRRLLRAVTSLARAVVAPAKRIAKKYESLSDKSKEKFRDGMRQMFSDEKFRNASEEDRRNAIRSMFDRIQKEDKR